MQATCNRPKAGQDVTALVAPKAGNPLRNKLRMELTLMG